jgi:DNA-binding GntR family transcriptional regulator
MAMSRTPLREQLKEVLLKRILEGEYQPGERIIETRVAAEFGVSQSPVREALRELETLRLVVSEPHRGVSVRATTEKELLEIYPVRAALEETAGREAAKRLQREVGPIAAQLDAMRKDADAGSLEQLIIHDVQFHRLIVQAAGNTLLEELWESLRVHTRTTITLLGIEDLHSVAESHQPVLDALAAGDAARAGRTLRRHIESFAKMVRAPEGKPGIRRAA